MDQEGWRAMEEVKRDEFATLLLPSIKIGKGGNVSAYKFLDEKYYSWILHVF